MQSEGDGIQDMGERGRERERVRERKRRDMKSLTTYDCTWDSHVLWFEIWKPWFHMHVIRSWIPICLDKWRRKFHPSLTVEVSIPALREWCTVLSALRNETWTLAFTDEILGLLSKGLPSRSMIEKGINTLQKVMGSCVVVWTFDYRV